MQSAIKVSASQLRALEGPYLKWQGGSDSAFALGVGTPDALTSSQLAFVSDLNFLSSALEKASLLIVEQKILPGSLDLLPHQALWSTPSLKAAMALTLSLFDPRSTLLGPQISPQAFIHPTAKIGNRTRIGAGACIGAGVEIGDDAIIHPGAVIEDFCKIGNRCVIHANATVGADGFGFATDPQGRHHKVPQIGIAVLEDDVELGANSTVDRATIGETRVGRGSKFDKHCHVAHNCQIGKYVLFAGGSMIAGSSVVGDHVTVAGSVVISDHVKIASHVVIGGRAAVTKDVTKAGAYTGYPLEPIKDGLRTIQNLTHLTEMRSQLKHISKRLGLPEESE